MQPQTAKEPRRRKHTESLQGREPVVPRKEPVQSQPRSTADDVHARIATRAYVLYAERGYRHGYALEDWLEAEREILSRECSA